MAPGHASSSESSQPAYRAHDPEKSEYSWGENRGTFEKRTSKPKKCKIKEGGEGQIKVHKVPVSIWKMCIFKFLLWFIWNLNLEELCETEIRDRNSLQNKDEVQEVSTGSDEVL